MKTKALLIVLLFISISSFGIEYTYTIPKADFIAQFSSPRFLNMVYCFNEKGNKVWIYCGDDLPLYLKLKNGKKKEVRIRTVIYKNDTITATEYVGWRSLLPSKKIVSYNIDEVESYNILGRLGGVPYFNLDSCRTVVRSKNDSLKNEYATGTEFVIKLTAKNRAKKDSFYIRADVCYHIHFKDDAYATFGVVMKITADSIYISNSFDTAMAKENKKVYTIYGYPVKDMESVDLRKLNNFTSRKAKIEDYDVEIIKMDKNILRCPSWYAFDGRSTNIRFYRTFKVDGTLLGITEVGGQAIVYEGGIIQ